MQEHPIPQDVTGYKFHIVGNMTLKQFAEVGAGVLLAIIIYNTNLIGIVKWPLIVLAAGLGAAMAFMPIEERPLDHWIITFIRRLYNPTKFYWRRENTVPFALSPTKSQVQSIEPSIEVDLTPARRQRITEYLESVKQPPPLEEWEAKEKSRVSDILQTFGEVSVEAVASKQQAVKPQLNTRVRSLSAAAHAAAAEPVRRQLVFSAAKAGKEIDGEKEEALVNTAPSPTPNEPKPLVNHLDLSSPDLVLQQPRPVIDPSLRRAKDPEMPLVEPTEIFRPLRGDGEEDEASYNLPATTATVNKKLPFPQKELRPNTIMGMVLTADDKLIDRAVVKIKNTSGTVIGALRTNLLGQFFATAPLPNGTYVVSVEKEGFSFPETTLSVAGAPLPPLELRAA